MKRIQNQNRVIENIIARRRINMLDEENLRVVVLGEFGLFARVIGETLGLTEGQVHYRLRKGNVQLRNYGRGHSIVARMVIEKSRAVGINQLRQFVEHSVRERLRDLGWQDGKLLPSTSQTTNTNSRIKSLKLLKK